MQQVIHTIRGIIEHLFPYVPLLIAVIVLFLPELVYAQSVVPHGTCTTDPQFSVPTPQPGEGLLSVIVESIQQILDQTTGLLFLSIAGDPTYQYALRALATLYVMFYGVMFTLGMVQITMFDFIIRMIKLGIIVLLLSPTSWAFFGQYVVQFFNAGTDAWINQISSVILQQPLPANAPPFYVIDSAMSQAVSAKMAVTLMAMFFTPPYGPIFGLLVALGLGTFVKAVLTAAWVYLMSLILKALLFGIAPIFLAFILFTRTRYLFDGWLNQIVNATLQPILLFTFLGFFVKLIEVSISNILLTPVCWSEWSESLRGSPFSMHYWRFALCGVGGGGCEPFGKGWGFTGPLAAQGPIFPIDIIGVLVLVMLADLASRFNNIVVLIASDLAAASTNLAYMQGSMGSWFKSMGGGKSGGGNSALPSQRQHLASKAAGGVGNRPGGPVGPN